jgi:hypothetical protein
MHAAILNVYQQLTTGKFKQISGYKTIKLTPIKYLK